MKIDPADDGPLEQAVRVLAEIHAQASRDVPSSQLGIERLTRGIGRPWFAYAAAMFLAGWIAGDLVAKALGGHPYDGAQFPWLQLIIAISSLMMTIFILITENRQASVAERRAQATLQIAIVSEQKIAKTIELLERLRRDDPFVPDRSDDQATRMAEATDLRVALSRLDEEEEKNA